MKLNYITILIFSCILMVSCADESSISLEKSNLESKVSEQTINTNSESEIIENSKKELSKYEIDFENYKLALEENDTSLLYRYNESDETDIETLLMLFSDSFFMEALKKTKYDELSKVNIDEQELLEFSVQQLDYDDDGNEIGAAVFLYFKESENKLLLHSYLAAG